MLPLSQRTRQLRRNILRLYAVTLIGLWGVILYSLHVEWVGLLAEEREGLLRHASMTSGLIHEALVDASKILDTTRTTLEKQMVKAPLDRHLAYDLIRSVVQSYSIYNTSDTLGLLLFLDKNGFLIAQNGTYPTPTYDLSERTYFQHLRDDPTKKFVVGKIRVAKTTGKWVFHLAMPVHDGKASFAGVVAYQIRERELAETLGQMLHGLNHRIHVQTDDGRTVFLFPLPNEIPVSECRFQELILQKIKETGLVQGTLSIRNDNKALGKTNHVGYVRDPLFGLVSMASIPESELIGTFLLKNEYLIGLSLLTSLAISALFYSLYRKALSLEHSLHEASFDHMTRIRNRRSLEREFQRLWRDAMRMKKHITVLFIDIDHFKEFNDTYGHAAGDRVLRATARVVDRSMRRPLDLCCRWGGEEFLAVLPETTAEEAHAVAERIRERVRVMKLKLQCTALPQITLSIGIASTRVDTCSTPEELIARADKALLMAKEQGRDQVIIC